MNFFMRLGHIPSISTLIIKNDSVVWSNHYGYYDLINKKEPSNQTIYMIGSITKTITATAILQLYEQGVLDLDKDVNLYLPFNLRNPNYPYKNITIRMLLSHRSSLGESIFTLVKNFFFFNYSTNLLEEYLIPGGCIYDSNVWIHSAPGEKFEYSNIGFEILGLIIETLTNQTLESYCRENIFNPLEMNNTQYLPSFFNKENLSIPYIWRFGIYLPMPHYAIGISAAAGLRSNIVDLSHFLITFIDGGTYKEFRLLKEDTVSMMLFDHYNLTPEYGLGWMISNESHSSIIWKGHIGSVFGGYACMLFSPEYDIGVIFLCNENKIFGIYPHFFEERSFIEIRNNLIKKALDN